MQSPQQQRATKCADAIARLQNHLVTLRRIQEEHPGETGIVVAAQFGREVNQVLYGIAPHVGSLEQIRSLVIGNSEFNPRYRGSPESVSLATVLSATVHTLRLLGVAPATGSS